MAISYYHVDAFAGEVFGGNPAGVCILEAFPSSEIMQKIAAENRHSETAFLVQRGDGMFDLRWFTPEVEDDLCGHATLAAAFVLRFHTVSGVLTVAKREGLFEMDFPARPASPCVPPDGLLPALGLASAHDILMSVRDYLVVLDHAEQVATITPDIPALLKLDMGIGGVMATAPGKTECDYVVRFFPPAVGIPEDPATGSIQCTLAPYWAKRLGKTRFHAKQISRRGGEMWSELVGERVKISGRARLYLSGSIDI